MSIAMIAAVAAPFAARATDHGTVDKPQDQIRRQQMQIDALKAEVEGIARQANRGSPGGACA